MMAWCCANLGEVEGHLIRRTGKGLDGLTPRQLCNVALSYVLENKDEYERDEMLNFLDGSTAEAEGSAQVELAKFQAQQARQQ